MNIETGKVLTDADLKQHLSSLSGQERRTEKRKWRSFDIGEKLTIKGIPFTVHEVGDQRVVLRFAG